MQVIFTVVMKVHTNGGRLVDSIARNGSEMCVLYANGIQTVLGMSTLRVYWFIWGICEGSFTFS